MKIAKPNWPTLSHVHAFTTTRLHDISSLPYHNAGIAAHADNHRLGVDFNRQSVQYSDRMPSSPHWLNQTHSTKVVSLNDNPFDNQADASITRQENQVLAIITADCLPILIAHEDGHEVAAIHAGWRGLRNGIIENTLAKLAEPPDRYQAWIGPAICAHCFEVGDEVCQLFIENYPFASRYFFRQERWHVNLPAIAGHIFVSKGLSHVFQSNLCTFEQKNLFYSYRRDGQTGRIGTFIWISHAEG